MLKLQVFLRLMCVWALLLTTQLASAHSPVHPETRVGAFEVAAEVCVRLSVLANSSGHQENFATSTAEASGYPHATKGAASLSKVLPTLGKMDARVVSRAAELAKGSTGFADDLAALARATGEVIPAGQVHALGQLGGQQVFGSAVSRIGIVASESGTLLVRSPLGEAVQVLGRFR